MSKNIGSTFPFVEIEDNYIPKIEKLLVETTTKCNAKCVFCGRTNAKQNNPDYMNSPDLDPKVFSKFDLSKIKFVCLCGAVGDASLYSHLHESIDIIKNSNKDCVIEIFTNGEPRSKLWWKDLGNRLKYNKYSRVVFCLDGLEESNRKYRGTDFNTVLSHIKAFASTGAWTHVQCILFKHNEKEIEQLRNKVKEAGANVFFTRFSRCYYNDFEVPEKCLYEHNLDEYAISLNRDPICALQNRNTLFIDVKGNAIPCCFYAGEIIPHSVVNRTNIGVWKRVLRDNTKLNLFEHSLEEILNTNLFKYVRDNYKNDIFCRTKCSVGREDSFEFFDMI